ncbi:hypothetical protein B0T25DRAFT_94266 [Lasiosphaeria hispida]|uniref:MARVEL domain-containing protein n=1 Tax=Lasiosphaeria hispida TaxID=260671 RepID=A0AAJ0HQ01_9PEZI|nr:hypothetical protein B0T25DRAFT_94266 [Lasiosphaeria hispida]
MFDNFEFDPEQIPAIKLGLHIAQLVFAFVLWCLEIAVFKDNDSKVTGLAGWTFAVCFLSIPAWIYLAMAPRFPRTRKLAEPRVMAVVDGLFAVIWLSALATQAAYNTADLCGQACKLSKAIVGLSFFVFLFFCITTFLSIYTVKYHQWNNRLPGYDKLQLKSGANIDPDKAAFSMAPHDEEAYAPVNAADHDDDPHRGPHSDYSDPYGAPNHAPDPYGAPNLAPDPYVAGSQASSQISYTGAATENPFRQDNPFDSDNEYHPTPSTVGGRYAAPSAQDEFEDDRRPVHFPSADYDRITR